MKSKHFILAPLYICPPLLTYVAATYLAIGEGLKAAPLFAFAAVGLAASYFRGLYLEERNEELDELRPTPLWPKRLPRWARDTLPETGPPPIRLVVKEEPVTSTRMRVIEWPGEVQRSNQANDDGETTETDTMAS